VKGGQHREMACPGRVAAGHGGRDGQAGPPACRWEGTRTAALDQPTATFRPGCYGAAERHRRRRCGADPHLLGDGGPDRGCGRTIGRSDDADPVHRAASRVRVPHRHARSGSRACIRCPPAGLAAFRGSLRWPGLVLAAPLHRRREVRYRRCGVGRRDEPFVPTVVRDFGYLRDRHRDGCVHRPGERAQADGRGFGQRTGRLGAPFPRAAQAADGVRRRGRTGRGL